MPEVTLWEIAVMRLGPVIRVTRQFLDQGPVMSHGLFFEETSAEKALEIATAHAEPRDKVDLGVVGLGSRGGRCLAFL
jgi:hypothetical protein